VSAIPSKLIMLRTLKEVPRSEYSDLQTPKDFTDKKERLSFLKMLRQKPPAKASGTKGGRQAKKLSFNAAVWLKFSSPAKNPVSLWLSYKDGKGENTILVDEQYLGQSTSAMLSGSVSINVSGNLEYLRACCGGVGVNESFSVDELHVRRLEETPVYLNSLQRSA